jgi:myo-inositol-1(or 4)-monophosphatase
MVSAGLADVMPKHEWDVAAGAALVLSAGGFVCRPDASDLRCNQQNPLLPGLLAGGPLLGEELLAAVHQAVLTKRTQ